jgi:hypothetical protein
VMVTCALDGAAQPTIAVAMAGDTRVEQDRKDDGESIAVSRSI